MKRLTKKIKNLKMHAIDKRPRTLPAYGTRKLVTNGEYVWSMDCGGCQVIVICHSVVAGCHT
jgi:hypothetical protein